jgi:hypothetical protein
MKNKAWYGVLGGIILYAIGAYMQNNSNAILQAFSDGMTIGGVVIVILSFTQLFRDRKKK